jgi:hypothetical protein
MRIKETAFFGGRGQHPLPDCRSSGNGSPLAPSQTATAAALQAEVGPSADAVGTSPEALESGDSRYVRVNRTPVEKGAFFRDL